MEARTLIAIAGDPWAGKSTIANYVATKFAESGLKIWMGSAFLQKIVRERGMPDKRESYDTLVRELTQLHGPNYMTAALVTDLAKSPGPVLYDGIRIPEEVERLKRSPVFTVRVVFVAATQSLRYLRGLGQPKNGRIAYRNWDEFMAGEELPIEQAARAIRDTADYVLRTDDWGIHTYEEIDKIFASWLAI